MTATAHQQLVEIRNNSKIYTVYMYMAIYIATHTEGAYALAADVAENLQKKYISGGLTETMCCMVTKSDKITSIYNRLFILLQTYLDLPISILLYLKK